MNNVLVFFIFVLIKFILVFPSVNVEALLYFFIPFIVSFPFLCVHNLIHISIFLLENGIIMISLTPIHSNSLPSLPRTPSFPFSLVG